MWLTDLWLYTRVGPGRFDGSHESDVVLRVGFDERRAGWREWTFPLDRPNLDGRARGQTQCYHLVFGPDDAARRASSRAMRRHGFGSRWRNGFVGPPCGPWLGDTTALPDARAELSRVLMMLEHPGSDRWSRREYTVVAQLSYLQKAPASEPPKQGSFYLSAKACLAHGEDPDAEWGCARNLSGSARSSEPRERRSLLVVTPVAGPTVRFSTTVSAASSAASTAATGAGIAAAAS